LANAFENPMNAVKNWHKHNIGAIQGNAIGDDYFLITNGSLVNLISTAYIIC